MKQIKYLICACCGNDCVGRQWWNQDAGYGLCEKCEIPVAGYEGEEIQNSYGKKGIHYSLPLEEKYAFMDKTRMKLDDYFVECHNQLLN